MKKFFKNRRKICLALAVVTILVMMFVVTTSASSGASSDSSFVGEAIQTVITSIQGIAEGASNAIVTVFDNIFLDADGGISNFAMYSLFFLGFSIIAGLIGSVIKKLG